MIKLGMASTMIAAAGAALIACLAAPAPTQAAPAETAAEQEREERRAAIAEWAACLPVF